MYEQSDFAQRFLERVTDPTERKVLEKYLPLWDAGYRKQEARWLNCQRIANLAMNHPEQLIALYRRRGILK